MEESCKVGSDTKRAYFRFLFKRPGQNRSNEKARAKWIILKCKGCRLNLSDWNKGHVTGFCRNGLKFHD